jgi:hypothetical protein
MPTIEEIARQSLAAVNSSGSFLLASEWIAARYQQLLSRARFKSRRKVAEVLVPPVYQQGTVTATAGSEVVLGSGTAFSDALVGQFLRAGVVWHEIVEVNPDGVTMTLLNPFSDVSVTNSAYVIANKRVLLLPEARWLSDRMVQMRTAASVNRLSHLELTMTDPARADIGPDPAVWSEVGMDVATGARQIEFYPYPDHAVLVGYAYWEDPPLLAHTDQTPFHIDPYLLKEGCMIDIMRYEMAKAAQAGDVNAAGFWRNESRAQETMWERHIQDAIKADTGASDVAAILQLGGSGNNSQHFSRGV